MRYILAAAAFVLFASVAQCDTVTVTAVGNFTSLDFSFNASYDWDTVANTLSNLTFSQNGLAPFTLTSAENGGVDFRNGTGPLYTATMGDILQIDFSNFSNTFPALGSYNPIDIDMIVPTFVGSTYVGTTWTTANGDFSSLTVTNPVDTPEPNTGAFLMLGLFLCSIGILTTQRRRD